MHSCQHSSYVVTVLLLVAKQMKERNLNTASMLLIMYLNKYPMKIDRVYPVHKKPYWNCIQWNITKVNTIRATAACLLWDEVSGKGRCYGAYVAVPCRNQTSFCCIFQPDSSTGLLHLKHCSAKLPLSAELIHTT